MGMLGGIDTEDRVLPNDAGELERPERVRHGKRSGRPQKVIAKISGNKRNEVKIRATIIHSGGTSSF